MGSLPAIGRRIRRVGLGIAVVAMLGLWSGGIASAQDVLQSAPQRWNPVRGTRDAFHPWTPPGTLMEWEREATLIREQVLVAASLWPMPEKSPLEPVIHGRVDREDYTVEKVYFAGRPGQYVTGNLYRPKNVTGRVPGVLSPYGHWAGGRFQDTEPRRIQQDLDSGGEQFPNGARFPIQARLAQLARMGCVVFHYDLVGYADDKVLPHREGFSDADAQLWLHGQLGLQTWNSIRSVDFLLSLPEVDPSRIAVTGASGGGTMTALLAAVDPRVAVAFPAVSVSTGMQGGCVCENACYLRQGINNVAIAALSAPRPLGLTGANDWTIAIETKGLPELKQVYSLYNQADRVEARAFPQFPHNFNQVSREVMYAFLHEHLQLGASAPVKQLDFEPLTVAEMSVFDESHPVPADMLPAPQLREKLRQSDRDQLATIRRDKPEEYERVMRVARRVMLQPWEGPVEVGVSETADTDAEFPGAEFTLRSIRYDNAELSLILLSIPSRPHRRVTLWLGDAGDDGMRHHEGVRKLLQEGRSIAFAGLFLQGNSQTAAAVRQVLNANDLRLVYAYNRPILSERVRDIQAVLRALTQLGFEDIELMGTGETGVAALLAAAGCDLPQLKSVRADLGGFSFGGISSVDDFNLLPGALKYGGLGGLASLGPARPLALYGVSDATRTELAWLLDSDAGRQVELHAERFSP